PGSYSGLWVNAVAPAVGWTWPGIATPHQRCVAKVRVHCQKRCPVDVSWNPRILLQTDRRVWGMLFGLSLLALALRLWRLNADLWVDEVLPLLDSEQSPIIRLL